MWLCETTSHRRETSSAATPRSPLFLSSDPLLPRANQEPSHTGFILGNGPPGTRPKLPSPLPGLSTAPPKWPEPPDPTALPLPEMWAKSLRCPTPCDPMDCSPPGFSVHGILQARILERVAISFSRGIFPSRASNPGLLHCRQILYYLSHIIHITSPWDTDSSSSAWLAFIPPPHWACFTLWIEADIILYSLFVSCVSPLKT